MSAASRASWNPLSQRRPRPRPGVAWAWWLALALLAAQALGFAHRVSHGPLASHFAAAALQATEPRHAFAVPMHAAAQSPGAHQGPQGLFDAHEPGSSDCRLLDQAAKAELLPVAALTALPPRPAAQTPAVAPTPRAAGAASAYLARGPPAHGLAGLHAA